MQPTLVRIALAGNPNAGKTTLFNRLTGSRQHIGNWPGVTVEKKEGQLRGHDHVTVQDLPGIYSLTPYTMEEEISRTYILHALPDVILNIVDSSNLQRNLLLTTQLLELGLPVVVALNMIDIVRKSGDVIDDLKLSRQLGCPVIKISALKDEGMDACVAACLDAAEKQQKKRTYADGKRFVTTFNDGVETALSQIETIVAQAPPERKRWYAIKAFERDRKALTDLELTPEDFEKIEQITAACETALDDDSESLITSGRYQVIRNIVGKTVQRAERSSNMTVSDRIDRVVTHRALAFPIFIVVMAAVYYIAITLGLKTQGLVGDDLFAGIIGPAAGTWLEGIGASAWLVSLVVDGIIAGVGSVLSFVPQMFILFILLALLEDVGYMARIAFILDRLFRRFGLSGKSFIPMLIGTGCSVPGIMATRTIENERDRRMTIINTPMIPCGAKLPIIALISVALFGGAWWVAPATYLTGIASVIVSGILLKKSRRFAGDPAPFVMELPAYHAPSPSNVLRSTWERGWSFIKRAGTIILLSSIFIWFIGSFGIVNGRLALVENIDESIAAGIGGVMALIFKPLGFGTWQAAIASIMGLVAKEEIVSVFGVLFSVDNASELVEAGSSAALAPIAAHFSQLSAFSFMLFNLFCPPCFAAIGAIRREMNSARWTWFTIGYLLLYAYVFAFIVYQVGLFMSGKAFTVLTGIAFALLAGVVYLLFRKPHEERVKMSGTPPAE